MATAIVLEPRSVAATPVAATETSVSGASIAAFRAVLGLIGAISCARFLWNGWVTALWTEPEHHFSWPGLWWVRPLPTGWMHAYVGCLGLTWLLVTWRAVRGGSSRTPLLLAALGFTYLGAIDIAPYLNHYVLLVVAAALAGALAEGRVVPSWTPVPLRAVIAITYGWAAVAKLNADWLSGRTLRPWLATHIDWPLVGHLFRAESTSRVLAIASLLFEVAVVPLLLVRRTRACAFAAVVAFHLATAALFPIGVFPWLMIGCTTIFFAPSWFDRWWPAAASPTARTSLVSRRTVYAAVGVLAVIPVRGYLSDVEWSEHGGRFAWRVMAANKVGVAELYVTPTGGGDTRVVQPARDLTPLQAQQVTWQPDLILQWAHLVARIESERLGRPVAVHADVWVSVNGAPPAQLVDPTVDLAAERWSAWRPSWVLPPPSD